MLSPRGGVGGFFLFHFLKEGGNHMVFRRTLGDQPSPTEYEGGLKKIYCQLTATVCMWGRRKSPG